MKRYSSRHKGASLIETMISLALLSIVLICVQKFLVAGMRYTKASDSWIDVQRETLLALVWVTKDLGESNRKTVKIYGTPKPVGLVFASPRSKEDDTFLVDPNGYLLWQQFICYYVEEFKGVPTLYRKALSVADEGFTTAPQVPPITFKDTSWFAGAPINKKRIASHIRDLEISGASPLSLKLAVLREDWGKKFEVEVQVKVFLRN